MKKDSTNIDITNLEIKNIDPEVYTPSSQKISLQKGKIPDLFEIQTPPNFKLPSYGSPELIEYLITIEIEKDNLLYLRGVDNLPNSDIEFLMKKTGIELTKKNNEKIRHLAQCLVFNRLSKRICDYCGKQEDNLKICKNCCLSWYCSTDCQKKHWDIHKLRCCNINGPLDEGYQKILLLGEKD